MHNYDAVAAAVTEGAHALWVRLRGHDQTGQSPVAANQGYCRRAIVKLGEMLAATTRARMQHAELAQSRLRGSPAYADGIALLVDHFKTFRCAGAPAWTLAQAWLAEAPAEAVALVEHDDARRMLYAKQTYLYLQQAGARHVRPAPIPDHLLDQRLAALGGAQHFLAFAVSCAILDRVCTFGDVALARYPDSRTLANDLPLLAHPGLRPRVAGVEAFWCSGIRPLVGLMGALGDEEVTHLAMLLLQQDQRLADVFDEGQAQCEGARRDAQLAQRRAASVQAELEALRRRLDHANVQVAQLSRQVAAGEVRGTHAAVALRDGAPDGELRRLRRELELARARELEQGAELLALREFCGLRRQAVGPDAPATEPADREVDLRDARVIVVGGSERFHHKLRPMLPRGVFLHPDLSACPADVFTHADCVLVCFDHCSHALASAALKLARRHAVRSGYTHRANPDLVLRAVRDLLAA